MTALESLMQQARKLSPNLVAELADFATFLAARQERQGAVQRLREDMAKLDAQGLPPITEDEVEEAVQQSRRERRRAAEENAASDDGAPASPRQRS
jgi:hypothetical protein